MPRLIFCSALLLLVFLVGGCAPGGAQSKEQPHLEGTPQDLRLLRIEGITDPDSERGQQRLRELKRDRESLEKILKEAEDLNMRDAESP